MLTTPEIEAAMKRRADRYAATLAERRREADNLPAFLRGPDEQAGPDRLDPAKVRVIGDEPEPVAPRRSPPSVPALILAIAIGGAAAGVLAGVTTDWLVGHGYWPGFDAFTGGTD